MRAPIAAALCVLAGLVQAVSKTEKDAAAVKVSKEEPIAAADTAIATPIEELSNANVFSAKAERTVKALITTFAFTGDTVAPPFYPDSLIFGPGTYDVSDYIGTGTATPSAPNLNVSNVVLTLQAGFTDPATITIPGAALILSTGAVVLSGSQTVTIVTAVATIDITVNGSSIAAVYPTGAVFVNGTFGVFTNPATLQTITVSNPAFYYPATNAVAGSDSQLFGVVSISNFTTTLFSLTDGLITVAALQTLTNSVSGAVYTMSPPLSASFLPAALTTTAVVSVNMPGASAIIAGGLTYNYPAATLFFVQPTGSQMVMNMLTGVGVCTIVGGTSAPEPFLSSSLGATFALQGGLLCTVDPYGEVACTLGETAVIEASVNGGDLSIWQADLAVRILTDGTSTSAGPAHFLSGEMAVVGGTDGWNLSSLGVLTLFGATEIVTTTDSLLVDASAARFPNTVGSLDSLTGVFTIMASSTLTSEQGHTIDAEAGGAIVRSGEVLTITLTEGAVVPLTALASDQYHVVLAEGTWYPATGCFAMAAGATFTVVNTLTDTNTAVVVLPSAGLLCPTGIVTNPTTGASVGYITVFGTWKTGAAPPTDIPANCVNMTTGMMVLLQQGGYDNALATCAQYGMEPLNVTVENIGTATALLASCGGLVKSVYVGAFEGTNDGGCIALYTGATVGSGTVAAAKCLSNMPVICVLTE